MFIAALFIIDLETISSIQTVEYYSTLKRSELYQVMKRQEEILNICYEVKEVNTENAVCCVTPTKLTEKNQNL